MSRPTIDDIMIASAILWSSRGTCNRKQVGAVIALDTRIVSTGYVGSPPGTPHCLDAGCLLDPVTGGCVRTQHAEANAIAFAARKGIAIEGGTLYVTLSPCVPCAKLIVAAGIARVVYKDAYRDQTGLEYLRDAGVVVDDSPGFRDFL